ncbi:MAG: HAMP domain-containing methyl-accepting chemotaxis protein [Candidatus Pelethousia sp.]|nr:HAMP domain-containing methyl-accepting chemotaxis protein [Candidatus Pelethousia sp.]
MKKLDILKAIQNKLPKPKKTKGNLEAGCLEQSSLPEGNNTEKQEAGMPQKKDLVKKVRNANLKVRTKLVISFATIVILFGISVTTSILVTNSLESKFNDFYDGAYVVRVAAYSAKQSFETIEKNMLLVAMDNSKINIQNHIDNADAAAQATLDAINALRNNPYADQEILLGVISKMGEMDIARQQVLALAKKSEIIGAISYYQAAYVPVADEASEHLDRMLEAAAQMGDETIARVRNMERVAMVAQVSIAVVCAALAIMLCVLIIRSITVPINELKAVAAQMAGGSLKVDIQYHAKDELGELADSIRSVAQTLDSYVSDISRAMKLLEAGDLTISLHAQFKGDFIPMAQSIINVVTSLNASLSRVKQISDEVANGSDQVAGASQQMAQGATEQASSVQELAATISQISDQVQDNAGISDQLNIQANDVGSRINQSNQQMQNMIHAMDEISRSSNEIGKIIKTIRDIAFQTNILALNAAIEAARAGEAGRGFAVVAGEVRNLASKSDEAAKNTTALIESTVKAVQSGTQIASATASSLEEVVGEAQTIIADIGKISRASDEQAQAISQVTQGVDQISVVVQTNSATAEESAAASQELSAQAKVLDEFLSHFKLKE